MFNPIISNGAMLSLEQPVNVTAANVTFTAAQWSAFVAKINGDMATTLNVGLLIGAVVGAIGLYVGMKYRGRQG